MTTYYYGLNRGQRMEDVVVGTSTNSTDIELAVNGANIPAQGDAAALVEVLEGFLAQAKFPPA